MPKVKGKATWTVPAFQKHERHLWTVAYRMTGSAADADDVVQETFARALDRPPARLDQPVRPWLTTVAVNLARDALRRRRLRSYVGPWLPTPVDSDALEAASDPDLGVEARYALRESVSFAFLVALEALTPQQRAVLVLRDVLDLSVRETARALRLGEASVKTSHHRARRALAAYDATRRPPDAGRTAEHGERLQRFLWALAQQDAAALCACLRGDARSVTDGGGEYVAALRPVRGRDRVVRFLIGLQRKGQWTGRFALRSMNGAPALCADFTSPHRRFAPRIVLRCEFDGEGQIAEVQIILAPRKLARVTPVAEP